MGNSTFRAAIFLITLSLLGACSTSAYHQYIMRGQVVQSQGDQVVVCVGRDDGVESGMTFVVYESLYDGSIADGTDHNYRLEEVGAIEVESLVDDHFARARVTSGAVKRYDLIEFSN